VVCARGEVDISSAPVLHRCLERAAAHGRSIIVDLRSITYLDGTGFRILEEAHARARDERRSFWIIPSRNVERLVTLLHLDDALPLSASVEDAMERMPQPASGTTPRQGGNGVDPARALPAPAPRRRSRPGEG
jgi:anti-anti-sigma factor